MKTKTETISEALKNNDIKVTTTKEIKETIKGPLTLLTTCITQQYNKIVVEDIQELIVKLQEVQNCELLKD